MGTDADQQCRICATDILTNGAVHIFAEEGRRHCLQAYIRKYLYILVSSEDNLPKVVCITCIKRLDGIHRFALMALKMQDKLKQKLNKGDVVVKSKKEESDIEKAMKRMEDRGLLHSILTKGSDISSDNEQEPSENKKEEKISPKMVEMEVKVDPMLFLQYSLDEPSSDYSDSSESEEKVSKNKSKLHSRIYSEQDDKDTDEKDAEDKQVDCSDEEISDETSLKVHKCTICLASFFSQIGLQNHLWSHLPRDRNLNEKRPLKDSGVLRSNGDNAISSNFICPICGKTISTKGNLKVHLETHRPKGKYGCDICGRIFKTQSNLYRHKEYHGGIQFPCNVCGRVYPTNSTLRAHSITHSDLRPHACPLCDKTFKRNQDLKFHINQHTGARPYQCPYCPKAFASSGNCFSHRKRMHPREVHRDRQRAADLMR